MQYPKQRIEPVGLFELYKLEEVGEFDKNSLRDRLSQIQKDLDRVCEFDLRNPLTSYIFCSIVVRKVGFQSCEYEDIKDDPSLIWLLRGNFSILDLGTRDQQIESFKKNYMRALKSAPERLDGTYPISIEIDIDGCIDVVRTQL